MTLAPAVQRHDAIDGFAAATMIGLTLSWGLNGVAAKFSNTGYDPLFLALARSVIGGGLVFVWCLWRGIRLFERDGTLWPGIFVGVLFAIEFLMIFIGLDNTSVGRSALLVNTMPFWTLIAGHFLLGEKASAQKVLGLLLAFGGLLLIFSDKLGQAGRHMLFGDLMSLGGGIAWAATMIVIKRSKLLDASAEKLLLYQLAASVVVTAAFLPFGHGVLRDPNMLATAGLLFQSVYIVAVTYVMWFWLMRRYPVSGLSSFAFLTPAFGVLFGGLFFGEPLGMTMVLSLGLIVAGLYIVNRPSRRPETRLDA